MTENVKTTVKETSLSGLAVVALTYVIPSLQAMDYLGAGIALLLGFGLLGYKYLTR